MKNQKVREELMERPVTGSAFSSSSIEYIYNMQMKVKGLVFQDEEVELGFEEVFGLLERKLGLLIDFSNHVERPVRSEQASEEEIRARKRYLDYELGIAVNICHVINDFIVRTSYPKEGVFGDSPGKFKMIMNKKEEMRWLKTQMDDFTERAIAPFHPSSNTNYESKEKPTVIGLEVDVQVLTRQLVQEANQMIWIVGAEGIGKTTLAIKVWDNVIVTNHFELHIWLTITRESKPRDILLNLLKKVPVRYMMRALDWYSTSEYSSHTLELNPVEVLHQIFSSARCLVVLDGLQTNGEMEALGVNDLWKRKLSNVGESRIMITTRNRVLARGMMRKNHIIHETRTLSDQDAWALFKSKIHVPIELETLGLKLVRKCMGYPLRILEVGDMLSRIDPTEDQWLKILNYVNQNRVSIVNELELAVDALSSQLKNCLSAFELFNDDYDIPVRRLIAYWVAEGLVQQKGAEPPEVLAEKQLLDFIQQNMIQVAKWKTNGRVKTCRMNHFLRDSWLSKVEKGKSSYDKKTKYALKLPCFLDFNHKEASTGTSTTVRLADHLNYEEKSFSHIHGNQKLSHSSFKDHYRNLCSLVSFDSREGPVPGEAIGKFLRGGIASRCFIKLQVLDLEGVFRPNLPKLIRKLLQLRYLGLRFTYIEGLPSTIGKLPKLHTLDLKHTCIRSLPCSVWKMQQLRHVYLSESYRSRILALPRTISLVDLQTLWGAFVDEETPIVDGLNRLINLRKLSLGCRLIPLQHEELSDWISKLVLLESLRLRSVNEANHPSDLHLKSLSSLDKLSSIYLLGRLKNPVFLQELPDGLSEITLSFSELVEDPMKKMEKLPNLRILNLYAASYKGKSMVCSSRGFPLLRVLNLWKLDELEDWIVEEGALAILKNLEIRSCNKLKRIPDGLKQLGACRELKLTNMPDALKARVAANEGDDWHKISHIPSIIIKNFPSS